MKRKLISLLLAVTLTASFIGCGKEEAQDSSSNVKEETEKVDSQNNQAENDNVESDIIVNEPSEENSGKEPDETAGSQISEEDNQESASIEEPDSTDIDEKQIINERTKHWFDDLDWDVTEEEKETLYQEFCAERIPFYWDLGLYQFLRCSYSQRDNKIYRKMAESTTYESEALIENMGVYIIVKDMIFYVLNGTDLYCMEYDSTNHFIASFDETIDDIIGTGEYGFVTTSSGKIYRIHYLSGNIDYVTQLYEDAQIIPYDSQGIFYNDQYIEGMTGVVEDSNEDSKSGEFYMDHYFNMETGKEEDLPEDYMRVDPIYEYADEVLRKKNIYDDFCAEHKQFIPSDVSMQMYEYEIDDNGNLLKWKSTSDKESSQIVENNVSSLYRWNEYVFYVDENDFIKYRIDSLEGVGYLGSLALVGHTELTGTNEYLYVLSRGYVVQYHIESQLCSKFYAVSEGAHNLRAYDNRSFLWDDAEDNTHYYDMELDSEQPVPVDAVGM